MDSKVGDILRNCYLFADVSDAQIECLLKEAEVQTFEKGDPVFLKSEHSHHIYFVQQGKIEIVVGGGSSQGNVVRTLGPG